MNKNDLKIYIQKKDEDFKNENKTEYQIPTYDPHTHYLEISRSKYFKGLTVLRHIIKMVSMMYWTHEQGAFNVDLFMMTPSVSSPMGPGSDSEAVLIKFGEQNTYLVDSSQFGFEPILLGGGIKKVFCYLPSMRGENYDKRHINQFYHCEAEIIGTMDDLIPQIEGYVTYLSEMLLSMPMILSLISKDAHRTKEILEKITTKGFFEKINFDEAIELLKENGFESLVNFTEHGADISNRGEIELMRIMGTELPIWIQYFDRDRVAFYQKPIPGNTNKTINSDLLFPPLVNNSFGGEIIGCGQRQDSYDEMMESIQRQGLHHENYEWYLNLRNQDNYQTTSGFGIGLERFITWILCHDDIKDAILYPRLKNIKSHP